MGHLPFLVAHGRAISIALVAAGGALSVATMRTLRTRREVKRIARERTARMSAVTALVAGPATIRGRLRGSAATAFAYDGMLASEHSPGISLDVEGTPVELRGDIEVLASMRPRTSWRGVPPDFDAPVERGAWHAFDLRDGDEVLATGKLARVAGSGDATYRDAAGGWSLGPTAKTSVIELFAANAVPRPPAQHPAMVVGIGLLFAAITYCLLWRIGVALVDHHPVLASALPHVRDDALAQLEHDLEFDHPRTDDAFAERFELAELQHGCAARARLEGDEERYEVELDDACGDRAAQIDALAHLGRYKEASAIAVDERDSWPTRNGTVALAAGDWNAAAVAADDLVRRLNESPSDHADVQKSVVERAQCYAAWFRAKAGDVKAAAALATMGPGNAACVLARVMLLPPESRRDALEAAPRGGAVGFRIDDRFDALAWAYGVTVRAHAFYLFDTTSIMLGRSRRGYQVWLAPLAASVALDGDHGNGRADRLAAVAALDAILGDFASAKARVADARQSAEMMNGSVDELGQAIALHLSEPIVMDPAAEGMRSFNGDLIRVHDGEAMHDAGSLRDEFREAALSGDGIELAHLLVTDRHLEDADVAPLLALLPRIHEHRAEVAAALHDVDMRGGMSVEQLPFGLLEHGATRRDLARLAGDEAAAKHWQQLIDAQLPVLADPDRVIALLLWQD